MTDHTDHARQLESMRKYTLEQEAAKQRVISALLLARIRWPQLRLGQVLCNVVDAPADLYYMSDTQLATRLLDYADTPAGVP